MPLDKAQADLGLAGLSEKLGSACARAADPADARMLAMQMLATFAEHDREGLESLWQDRPDATCGILAALGGAAPFLLRHLGSDTKVIARLAADDLSVRRSRADYPALLAKRLEGMELEGRPAELRRFKYEELARITLRDLEVVPIEETGATLAEVSHLADALLAAALAIARAQVLAKIGPPLWYLSGGSESFEPAFAVLGLGKLGSEELNYSSDVDLVYVYQNAPGSLEGGPRDLAPVEYFSRLAQAYGRIVAEVTGDGFLYRVDLDLRPEGKAGPLVISSENYLTYFEAWADTWEKAAFMKARVVAGDEPFGWRVIRAMDPMIYSGSIDYAGLEAIKGMKRKVEADQERKASTFNVKLGSGGIRDVEFVAQAAQLLHGGRIPQIRLRGTQETLRALAEVNLHSNEEVSCLLHAYWFLRRVENRLQMVGEQQTHSLPDSPEALTRLARSMGFVDGSGEDCVAAFEKELDAQRRCVRESFGRLFFEEEGDQVLALFDRSARKLMTSPGGGPMIEALAARLTQRVQASADPERALNNLSRFIEGVGSRSFYYGLLLDRPELIDRLVRLFAGSDFLSSFAAAHPRLVESLFDDPDVLLLSREQLEADAASIAKDFMREGEGLDEEGALDGLRAFVSREVLNTGLLDLDEKVSLAEAEAQLTEVAEVCAGRGLQLSKDLMALRGKPLPEDAQFLIVGMGKLGSRELSYGSDLDVIFFFDSETSDAFEVQDLSVRLAQKFINVIQTRTAQGICYEIDARLRPSGRQGMLVVSLESFCKYHEKSAEVWERQALLRARPVAGNEVLAKAFERARREVLLGELPGDFAEKVRHIRGRMEHELAKETSQRRDLKTGRGGILDVESLTQYLQLLHAREYPQLIEPVPTARVIEVLAALGLLGKEDAAALGTGWQFLKRLSSRLRVVENRSISDFDQETGDLTGLALRMGYEKGQRDATCRRRLLEDYRRNTEAIREAYLRVLGE